MYIEKLKYYHFKDSCLSFSSKRTLPPAHFLQNTSEDIFHLPERKDNKKHLNIISCWIWFSNLKKNFALNNGHVSKMLYMHWSFIKQILLSLFPYIILDYFWKFDNLWVTIPDKMISQGNTEESGHYLVSSCI